MERPGFIPAERFGLFLSLVSMVRRSSTLTLLKSPQLAPQPSSGGVPCWGDPASSPPPPTSHPRPSGFVRSLFRAQLLILKHTLGVCSLPL